MSARAFDIVVLSSSPPNPPEDYAPSSPPYTSLEPSTRRAPMAPPRPQSLSPPVSPQKSVAGASKSALRKAPIPPDAMRGFATVGSLVRSEHFAHQANNVLVHDGELKSRRNSAGVTSEPSIDLKKPKKRSAEKPAEGASTKPKPKPKTRARKSKSNNENVLDDPELRPPPRPRVSPYFASEALPISVAPEEQVLDVAPKLTKAGKPRKPRVTRKKAEGEAPEPKVKKTKATGSSKSAKSAQKGQEPAVLHSAHFSKATSSDTITKAKGTASGTGTVDIVGGNNSIWDMPESPKSGPRDKDLGEETHVHPLADGLDLDVAVSRRRDWTPPRDTVISSPLSDPVGKENKRKDRTESNDQFMNMISNFAYTHVFPIQTTAATERPVVDPVITKRRRIELVDLPSNQSNSRNSSPEKGKAPKKKARTITDRATEQYLPRDQQVDQVPDSNNFFESGTTTSKVPLNDSTTRTREDMLKKPSRKRSTRAGSGPSGANVKSKKASTKSSAKTKMVVEKLLSPTSALTRISRQEMLFGTSSQLAMEESPTMVRQIQQALKESEKEGSTSLNALLDPLPQWPRLGKVRGTRGLWNASSRDADGGLLEQEEDIYMPEFDRTKEYPLLMDGTNGNSTARTPKFDDIDKLQPPPAPILISSDPPTPPLAASRTLPEFPRTGTDSNINAEDSIFEDIDDIHFQPPPSNQKVGLQDSFADIDDIDLPPSAQPKYQASLVTSRAPSSHKKPGRPPKMQSAIPFQATKPRSGNTSTVPIPKLTKSASAPPLTPSKLSHRFIDIEEILDSEDEMRAALSPTPPRTRKLQQSEPLPLFSLSPRGSVIAKSKSNAGLDSNLVEVHKVPTEHLIWDTIKPLVFTAITTHIRSLIPSTDPKNPNWHEKMLMYDPIVLEDFTAYLTTHTSIRTYRKATQKQIKAWNKELKSQGDEELGVVEWGGKTLAVQKELECYQVREWCEGLSICCIWGEGRGKGGARKTYF